MISHLSFILLQLLLILFWRQIKWLKSRTQPSVIQVFTSEDISTRVDVAAVLVHHESVVLFVLLVRFKTFVFHLHQDFDGGFDVVQHRKAVELCKSISFFFELVVSKSINLKMIKTKTLVYKLIWFSTYLIIGPDFHLQVQVDDSCMQVVNHVALVLHFLECVLPHLLGAAVHAGVVCLIAMIDYASIIEVAGMVLAMVMGHTSNIDIEIIKSSRVVVIRNLAHFTFLKLFKQYLNLKIMLRKRQNQFFT